MNHTKHTRDPLLRWLLAGDVSIQFQAHRDLLGSHKRGLQQRIAKEGWGKRFLSAQKPDGHWGDKFYQPKWISTHYTILDLKHLAVAPRNSTVRKSIQSVLENLKGPDGGVLPIGADQRCDVCVNGMLLNYAAYFRAPQELLTSVVDFLLDERMNDGGFNCESNRGGAVHSSLHSTVSVAEGIHEYTCSGYQYRLPELQMAERSSQEFMLQHRLFRSDRTGDVIDRRMTMLSFPSRWRYDILRALDYFRSAGVDHDARMDDAIAVLLNKRRRDGRWPLQARHAGQTHFEMERTGAASRWNTLRVMRVFEHFGVPYSSAAS